MDFTPVTYRAYQTGTTDAHQTALSVIFTSYVMHVGDKAEYVLENPCRPFLEKIKTVWDETRLLEGAPGNYVTMARRSGSDWFIGSICARRPRKAELLLDMLEDGVEYRAELYADDLSGLRPFDVAEGVMDEPSEELVDQILNHTEIRPYLHNHDMHAVRVETFTVKRGDCLEIAEHANGGFALYLAKTM